MKKKQEVTYKRERNPFVAQMRMRRSGTHQKSQKAQRAKDRAKLKKEW